MWLSQPAAIVGQAVNVSDREAMTGAIFPPVKKNFQNPVFYSGKT